MQVKKSTQETVYPATPSPGPGVIELSYNDQIMPRTYTSLLLFFDQKSVQQQDASALLKSSLAEVLSSFYPLAGRFRESSINGELEIVCNDAGASFHEVWVDCAFDIFSPNFDPHPQFAILVPPRADASASISDVPLLLTQITHFECGRICLGIRLHHNVCDGFSTCHFLSSWAILANKAGGSTFIKGAGRDCTESIMKPHIDRSLLNAKALTCPHSDPSNLHPEYQITHLSNFISAWPAGTLRIFPFTPSFIDDLRARLTRSAGVATMYTHTRFEALAAYLWRGIISARGLAPDQEIRLGMAVDGRSRFNPPLPECYFGNVVFYGYTTCKAGDLVTSPLPFAADLVKSATAKVDDAHMRSALGWLAMQKSPKSVIPSFCVPLVDLSITSWSRFPFYELDFGWGKPSYVRNPSYAFDGLIILMPSPLGAGHVDALVGLNVETMPKFEHYIFNHV